MVDEIVFGDTFELIKRIPDNSFSVIITDPVYTYTEEDKHYLQEEFLRVCNGVIIVFSPPENQWVLPADQYLFWIKPISTKNTSKNYSRFVEMLFVYGRHIWNSKRHWSQYPNVMTDLVEERDHPWRKPISLIQRLVLNHSKEGDTIFDPFMGSGTTAIAAMKNNRHYFGFENDLVYYNMAKERIKKEVT